jgi:twitching motility protein PilT
MEIAELLKLTKDRNASDLHLTVGSPPALRIHGEMIRTDLPVLDRKVLHALLYEILTEEQKARFDRDHEIDFSVDLEGVARFRVNVYLTRLGEAAAFRLIPAEIPSVEQLRLPAQIKRLTELPRGLVLVTGPTGSGKSTTLAALLALVNAQRKAHVITLEDPIEYVHSHHQSIINQREIGHHSLSFSNALRAALREDPDVIMVGEMRDVETIQLALTAAETGHLVFSTLHTASAGRSLDRIVDVFPADQQEQIRVQLAEAIEGVLAQTLVPTVDEKGRVVAMEVMFASGAIRNLIRENKAYQIPNTIQLSNNEGMQTLDQSLVLLLREGVISREEALSKAYDRKNFEQLALGKTPMIQNKPLG